jgi:hypothetical protein
MKVEADGNWPPFMFDGNQYNGLIDSLEKWADLSTHYQLIGDWDRVLDAKRGPDLPDGTPMFGFLIECQGETLHHWAMNIVLDSLRREITGA